MSSYHVFHTFVVLKCIRAFLLFSVFLLNPVCVSAAPNGNSSFVKHEKKFLFSAHHQVVLDLLVHAVEGTLSVHHGHLGFFVLPGPDLVLLFTDVFVTQAQRPQGRVGKDLKHRTQTTFPSTETKEAHMCTSSFLHVCRAKTENSEIHNANENKATQTHIQSCLGSFFVSGVGGESLIYDSVSSFTVETNTTIRKLH